jgi:hypothetical protein
MSQLVLQQIISFGYGLGGKILLFLERGEKCGSL